jgi:hypothetical protein
VWREGRTAEVPWEDGRRSCSATAGGWLSSPLCNRSTIRGINKLSALVGVSSRGGQHDHMGWTAACHDTRQDTTHATPEEKKHRSPNDLGTEESPGNPHPPRRVPAPSQRKMPAMAPRGRRRRALRVACSIKLPTLRAAIPTASESDASGTNSVTTTGHHHTHAPHLRASLPVTPPFRSRSVPHYT